MSSTLSYIPGGTNTTSGNVTYTPAISQYCVGAWQGRIRGQNLVPDLSRNQANLQYINATADTDVLYVKPLIYDTFTSGSATTKGLLLHNSKINGGAGWELNSGDSLLMMWRAIPINFKTFSVVAGTNTGNGTLGTFKGMAAAPGVAATVAGAYVVTFTSATSFSVADPSGAIVGYGDVGVQYIGGGFSFLATAGGTAWVAGDKFTVTVSAASGSTIFGNNGGGGETAGKGISLAVSAAGVWTLSVTVGSASTQTVNVTPSAALSPTPFTTLPETFYNCLLYVDGTTKRVYFSVNGEYSYTNADYQLMPDSTGSYSTVNATPFNMGFGFSGGTSNGTSVTTANPVTFQSLSIYVIPGSSGLRVANPRRLEKLFNADPVQLFSGQDLFGYYTSLYPTSYAQRKIAWLPGIFYGQSNELGPGCTMAATIASTSNSQWCRRPSIWGTLQESMTTAANAKMTGVNDLLAERIAVEYGATVAYENWCVGGTGSVLSWCGKLGSYAASTAYGPGEWVLPGNGYKYKCQTAGTSGSSAPSWTTVTPATTTATYGTTAYNVGISVSASSVVQVNNVIRTDWTASGTTITFTTATGTTAAAVQVGDTITVHTAPTTDSTVKWLCYPIDSNDVLGHVYAYGESGYDPLGYMYKNRKALNKYLALGYEVHAPAAGHQADLQGMAANKVVYADMVQAMKNIITDSMGQTQTVNGVANTVKGLYLGVTPRYYQSTFDTSTAYNTLGNAGAWTAGGFLQNLNSDLLAWMNTNYPGIAKLGGDLSVLTNTDFFVDTPAGTGDKCIHQNDCGINKQVDIWWTAIKGF